MTIPTPARRTDPPVPLSALTGRRRDLAADVPVPLTSLVGREQEIATLSALLRQPSVRLLTLTGPGGVGKTRLALRLAEDHSTTSGKTVRFVNLAPILVADLVAPAIAQALGIRTAAGQPVRERLTDHLRDRDDLLLLDNMEQVLDAGPLIVDLLTAAPRVTILVTSRAVLRVSGEHDFQVPPLSVTHVPAGPLGAVYHDVANAASVRLFVVRARSVRPDFTLTAENAGDVAGICARLDGLPLGIELAAARCRTLSPGHILARLDRRLPLLTGGPRDQPARLRTMRDTIAWSHDLLDAHERALFRRLSIFSGSFALDAAEAVVRDPAGPPDDPDPTVFDGIVKLVDHSLVEAVTAIGDPALGPRFALLETIREFGLEQLAASADGEAVRRRHVDWCISLLEQGRDAPRGGQRGRWAERVEADYPNVRDAMNWALDHGDAVVALRLGVPLVQFWTLRNAYISEGRGWLERALANAGAAPPALRAEAMVAVGALAKDHDLLDQGERLLTQGLALARTCGAVMAEIRALVNLGIVARFRGDHVRGMANLREALDLSRAADNPAFASHALSNMALDALRQGLPRQAATYLEEGVTLARASGDPWVTAISLYRLGAALRDLGDLPASIDRLVESTSLWPDHGDQVVLAEAVAVLAGIASDLGQSTTACTLFAAADAYREANGMPTLADWRTAQERSLGALRERMGVAAFAAAWTAGRELSFPRLLATFTALRDAATKTDLDRPRGGAKPPGGPESHLLTRRERDILRLLATGQADKEIASELGISRRTVTTHLGSIYAKLNLASRAAAAAYAVRHGLD